MLCSKCSKMLRQLGRVVLGEVQHAEDVKVKFDRDGGQRGWVPVETPGPTFLGANATRKPISRRRRTGYALEYPRHKVHACIHLEQRPKHTLCIAHRLLDVSLEV